MQRILALAFNLAILFGVAPAAPNTQELEDSSALYQRGLRLRSRQFPSNIPVDEEGEDEDEDEDPTEDLALEAAKLLAHAPETKRLRDLDKHRKALTSLLLVMTDLELSGEEFGKTARAFRKALEVIPSMSPKEDVLELTTQYINASFEDAYGGWKELSEDFSASFLNMWYKLAINGRDDHLLDGAFESMGQTTVMGGNLYWFTGQLRADALALMDEPIEARPAKMVALEMMLQQFEEMVDKWALICETGFGSVLNYVINSVRDPFLWMGEGDCLDGTGKNYTSLKAEGCQTPLECMAGCRLFGLDECRGFTTTHTEMGFANNTCGRCELRLERGTNITKTTSQTELANGTGMIQGSDSINPAHARTNCFRRDPPDVHMLSSLTKEAVGEEEANLEANYLLAISSFTNFMFRIKGAFWDGIHGVRSSLRKAVHLAQK